MISLREVSKSFGRQTVLDKVSLEIRRGVTTAVVGPSGAGKSVLLKILMGIITPDSGQVVVCDEDMASLRTEAQKNKLRLKLGFLFQNAALFDRLTVRENIAFPLVERRCCPRNEVAGRVTAMLDSLSLEDDAGKYPQEIPIGTRKRAAIARALVTEPEVVLFDEPNTGLDPLVGQEVYDLIRECERKWDFTGVVISHELPEVFQVSERVAMLLNGRIVMEGTPHDVQTSTDPAVVQFLNGRTDGPIKIH